MECYDVIVVGAGPAGSASAIHLARAGARVLLLDRARFPRDKPCGGGLTTRAVRELPVAVDPVVEDRVDRFYLRLRYGRAFTKRTVEPVILMTQRRRLDAFLARAAGEAGAEVRDGTTVRQVTVGVSGASVTVEGRQIHADVVVGADGANGITARSLGLGGHIVHGVALEGNASYDDLPEDRIRGWARVELGTVPGGYGWIFPKAEHANFGVGGWAAEGPRLRGHLERLCRAHGVEPRSLTGVRGHRLPMRRPGSVTARGRALLVGDAAGLVDPLTGDGMYEAFVSARLASSAVLDLLAGRSASLEPYPPALAAALGREAMLSWAAKHAADRFPWLTFTLARTPSVWRRAEDFLEGAPGGRRRQLPLRALKALVQRASRRSL